MALLPILKVMADTFLHHTNLLHKFLQNKIMPKAVENQNFLTRSGSFRVQT